MSATELLLFLTYLLSVCGSDDRFAYQDSPICASNDLKVSFGTPTSTFECEDENIFQTKYQKHDLNNDALPRVQSSRIRNMCKHRYNLSAQQSASFTCPPTDSIPSSCKRIFCTKDKYIKTVMPYMASKYGITDSKAYKEVLSTIYNFFRGDMNRIIIVLAHSIFTTSGFTQLVNVNTIHDKYGCKGILQFYGESNYKLASENFDFVKYPSEMAVLGTRSTIGTLQGYCKINPDDTSNYFFESLVVLNPGEVQIMNLKKESTRLKITERVRVLNELKNLFNVEILFAKSGKHIPVEIQRILQDMPKLDSADTIILM